MFTVTRFRSSDALSASKANAIRQAVFVEEQGVDPALEYEHETESHHYLLSVGEKALATARWRETEQGIKLERFAVLPAFRNRGIGEMILNAVLDDVLPLGKPVYLHAQVGAVTFYLRNGFEKEGDPFFEAGIEHYRMVFPTPANDR